MTRTFDAMRDVTTSRPIVAADDLLHPPAGDDPYWRETAWWSVTLPQHGMGMWIYANFHANLGTSVLGVWLWDAASHVDHDLVYASHRWSMPMPEGDLDDMVIGGNCSIRQIEPLTRHELRYRDGDLIAVDLVATALLAPQPVSVTAETGHTDQPLWFTGTIEVGGRTLTVDGPGIRDRSWVVRPPSGGRPATYDYGTSPDLCFHALTFLAEGEAEPWLAGGFLHRDGETVPLASAHRRVTARGDGPPTGLVLELTDRAGRSLTAVGRVASAAGLMAVSPYLTWASTVAWTVDGREVWGEDNEAWTNAELDRLRRRRRAEVFMQPDA